MAKIKLNCRVKITGKRNKLFKKNHIGETGRVVDIAVENNGDKKIKTYGVLLEGSNKLEYFDKSTITPIKSEKNLDVKVYPKSFSVKRKAKDGRTVMVVGLVEKSSCLESYPVVFRSKGFSDLEGTVSGLTKRKKLSVGYSICHPEDADSYSDSIGFKIAKGRCKKRPMTVLESYYTGEFREDLVLAILNVKADYIVDSIEKGELKFIKSN